MEGTHEMVMGMFALFDDDDDDGCLLLSCALTIYPQHIDLLQCVKGGAQTVS